VRDFCASRPSCAGALTKGRRNVVRPVAQAEPPLAKSEVEKRIAFTNLNKVFWPEQGFTKGDLIDYYRRNRALAVALFA